MGRLDEWATRPQTVEPPPSLVPVTVSGSADRRASVSYPAGVQQNDFDSRVAGLVANLDEAIALLTKYGETHWAASLMQCRVGLFAHDGDAFDQLLGAFGGMGSFNDLLILPANGHDVRPDEEKTINEQLWDLRELIWTSATSLRSELPDSM